MEKFTEILKNTKINEKLFNSMPKNFKNLIIYGPLNSNKYGYAINLVKLYSDSDLTYEKKVIVNFNNNEYIYRMSDVHIEINFEFLGCVAKNLWATIYQNIQQIANRKDFYIICKNFSSINNELMENFYTYINNSDNNIHFIFLLENIGCVQKEIIDCCFLFYLKKMPKSFYNNKEIQNNYVNTLTNIIIDHKNINIKSLRITLYDLLIYQVDIYDIFFRILNEINNHNIIDDNNMIKLLNETKNILKLFNNNYRSIYHLENFIMTLIKYTTN